MGYQLDLAKYFDTQFGHCVTREDINAYSLWCLGHNLDIVATIMTMSSLSWQRGYDAGIAIAGFSNKPEYTYRSLLEQS